MKPETYKKVQSAVAAVLAMGVAVSVLQNSVYLALAFVIPCIVLLMATSRMVTGVRNDEMVYRMAEKSAMRAYQIFVPLAAFLGLLIVVTGWFPGLGQAGQTLVYSALGLMLLYSLFYGYYGRRGGL